MTHPLVIERCATCEQATYPRRLACPVCGASTWTSEVAEGGVVEQVTIVRKASTLIASVRTDAGPMLVARVTVDVQAGARVVLQHRGQALWATPVSDSESTEEAQMPVVTIQMWEGQSVENKRRMAKGITDVLTPYMNHKPESIHIVFQEVPLESWASGGQLSADRADLKAKLEAGRPPSGDDAVDA